MTDQPNTPTLNQLDAVLAYLPLLEQPDFAAGQWQQGGYQLPYFSADPRFDEFIDALYEQRIVFEFDWMAWQPEAERYRIDPALVAATDLLTLRKLLTAHVRADRFVAGHLAQMLESGHLLDILRRLRQIRDELAAEEGAR